MFGFPSKTPLKVHSKVFKHAPAWSKNTCLHAHFFGEMLEDPYCFNRIHVRRHLVRFFKIPKDSHHPMMWMSSCASRGDENHQGSSSPAASNCLWPYTFVRNRVPACDFCRPVMRNLRVSFDLYAPSREVAYCALGAAYMSVVR